MLSPHPLAELFPPMDDETFKLLVADIRANGLREPIFLWDGMILDGRNRYRACTEIGISPVMRHWEGPGDPLDFVISKNLHRRHLDEGQRAMVAARIADMKSGDRTDLRPIGRRSQPEAAALMNIGERSVRRAKVVLEKGAPELQAAVERGAVSVSTAAAVAYALPKEEQSELVKQGPAALAQVAKAARTDRVGPELTVVAPTAEATKTAGGTITVPEGSTVEEQVRKAMALEADGQTHDKAAKQAGIGDWTYRRVRDLVVLLEELELNPTDRQIITRALGNVNETKQLAGVDAAEPIIRRVWGSNQKNHHTVRTARKRVEHFATVAGLAVQSCANFDLEEFEIPYLLDEETKRWVKELESARKSLDAFIRKLKG